MKILIIGATGGIGKYLVDYLINVVNFPPNNIIVASRHNIPYFEKLNIEYCKLDISQKDTFGNLPPHVDVVIDLAGAMPARMNGYNPQIYIDVNITGTINILNYCKQASVDRILFAQSFGDIKNNSEKNILLKPDTPRCFSMKDDHTVYVLSKNMAVDLIDNYHQMYGLKKFIFRLPTIHSYSQQITFYHNGIEKPIGYRLLIEKAMNGEPIAIWGDPSRKKDMVYVKDFCQMLYKTILVDIDSGLYNVGTGIGTSLEEQIRGIVNVFSPPNNKSEISYRPDMPNAPQYIMDISNAKKDLGYKPVYSYMDMLCDMKKEMLINKFD